MSKASKNKRYYDYAFTYFFKYQQIDIIEEGSETEQISLEYELKAFNIFMEEHQHLFKYYIYQVEKCPNTSRLHLQGYLYLKHNKTFSALKKYFKNDYNSIHLEIRRAPTPKEAVDYCKKEDSKYKPIYAEEGYLIEFGRLPSLDEIDSQGNRTDIEDFIQAINEGMSYDDLLLNFPSMMLRYDKFYEKQKKLYLKNKYMNSIRKMENELYTGLIYQEDMIQQIFNKYGFNNVYRLPSFNKYAFDDYNNEDVVLIDNYKEQFIDSFLIRLCSGAPMYLGARYESKVASFTKVIVLTAYDLKTFTFENRIINYEEVFKKVKQF